MRTDEAAEGALSGPAGSGESELRLMGSIPATGEREAGAGTGTGAPRPSKPSRDLPFPPLLEDATLLCYSIA
ncbi:MAG TPA: hypothetical protein VGJ84_05055 [Polyangiaceae bacterium]